MSLRGILLVTGAAILTAVANVLLRAGVLRYGEFSLAPHKVIDGLMGLIKQPLFSIGVLFYGLAAMVWFSAISIEELSTSYPVLVGLTFFLVTASAIPLFSESYSVQKLAGLVVILGGIVLIARA